MSVIRSKHISDTDKYIRHYTNPQRHTKGLNTISHNYVGKVGDISSSNVVKPIILDNDNINHQRKDIFSQDLMKDIVKKRKRVSGKKQSVKRKRKRTKQPVPKKKSVTAKKRRVVTKKVGTKKRLPDIL